MRVERDGRTRIGIILSTILSIPHDRVVCRTASTLVNQGLSRLEEIQPERREHLYEAAFTIQERKLAKRVYCLPHSIYPGENALHPNFFYIIRESCNRLKGLPNDGPEFLNGWGKKNGLDGIL